MELFLFDCEGKRVPFEAIESRIEEAGPIFNSFTRSSSGSGTSLYDSKEILAAADTFSPASSCSSPS